MRTGLRYLPHLMLGGATLTILLLLVQAPLVYSLAADVFPSAFHDNPDVLKQKPVNSTTDLVPALQELIDFSGPVALSIHIRDVEEAKRELLLFSKSNIRVGNLIVTLDMKESDIEALSKNSKEQMELLSTLLNQSIALDALQNLRIQYQGDENMLISIDLQGAAVRAKIRELYGKYQEKTSAIAAIGSKYGLDTAGQQEGLAELRQYLDEIGAREPEVPIRRTRQLTFLPSPESGSYGESVTFFGYLFDTTTYRARGIPNATVTVYADELPAATAVTDSIGSYAVPFRIERIAAGTHPVYAQAGPTLSEVRTLTVVSAGSATTLAASIDRKTREVACTGTVLTGDRPVRHAPVELVADGTRTVETTTDSNGAFTSSLRLPAGSHTLVARFGAEGFPLSPSESEPVAVEVAAVIAPEQFPAVALAAIGILAASVAGAAFYLRRVPAARHALARLLAGELPVPPQGQGAAGAAEGALVEAPAPLPAGEEAALPADSLALRYGRVLEQEGLSAASFSVYREFAGQIAREIRIPRHQSLTPRELAQSCIGRAYCRAFAAFVAVYEEIRYAGRKAQPVRAAFEQAMHKAGSEMSGGRP